MIREAQPGDAQAICDIYNPYVLGTTITFEEEAVSPGGMAGRMAEVQAVFPWLVLEEGGEVLGYAYAGKWKARSAYRHTVESTIYLRQGEAGRGQGRLLYTALLEGLGERQVHAVIGGITQPNPASVGLHEALGFRKVGHLSEVGWKFGRWLDVGYWELILESPSGPA